MTKIDSTRLSNVLAALAKPKEQVTSTVIRSASLNKSQKSGKDLEVLRFRLCRRLNSLKQNQDGFHQWAPVVTVQEILCWEFGEGILEHPKFQKIAQKVAEIMLENPRLGKAIHTIVEEMVSGNHNPT